MAAAGDYYRGAAQGDLFGFIGKAVKGITGVAGSILPGPLGTVAKGINSLLGGGAAKQNPIGGTLAPPVIGIRGLVGGQLPVLKPDSTVSRGVTLGPLNVGSTTTYYSPDGTHKKRRRMNVTNVKALRRAGRRVKGFEKLARRFVGFAAAHKPKGRMYFKSRKRS